ncbi:hypothetical protein [Enterobacter roggenkampii]|uniref:hypothetical protein n=1 Tax=Enterobacter roggenkampii TaxID=1812935 RepID=UPI003CC92117
MADIAEVLWNDFLKHNPNDPTGTTETALFSPTATPRCCSLQPAAPVRLRSAA